MRKTDISRYKDGSNNAVNANAAITGTKSALSIVWKTISTVLMIIIVTGLIFSISLGAYLFSLANQPSGIDLNEHKEAATSIIYYTNSKGKVTEYARLHDVENRIWVDYEKIPTQMIDAVISIEDKRFEDHQGVDWVRTIGAVFNLSSGEASFGGSTLTQQLIKNITGENDVSITRKLNEIFRALNLEREFTKDQIVEAYLNIVNFGSNCHGVEAAANLYFGKSIQDCTIAQCAAIAGITQNPAAYTPLIYPENNKERRETVLLAMYEQGKISKSEYQEALKESENMTFVGYVDDEEEDEKDEDEVDNLTSNWYMDAMIRDASKDLEEAKNLSEDLALNQLYTGGYKIYCAMDLELQEYAQEFIQTLETPYDRNLEIASVVMGLDGRILATVGSREPKTQRMLWDKANMSKLQPGSTVKPIFPYAMAIEEDIYHYSSLVKDEPIEHWRKDEYGNWKAGPNNTTANGEYAGEIALPDALERSSNATAAQTMLLVGAENAYNQAINKFGFRHLSDADSENVGSLSLGAATVTVRELAAAYQYMGNGGKYYKPYTYFYIEDRDGNVILDNRETVPIQAYSNDTASIMNRLLNYNVENNDPSHTSAGKAKISGWNILGKTGTTDNDFDHWFAGLSPYATCAVWTGFDTPSSMSTDSYTHAVDIFRELMAKYLENKEHKEFKLSDNLETHTYCAKTGLLASSYCSETFTGYYKPNNKPEEYCSGWHSSYNSYSSNNDYNNYYSDSWSSSSYDDTWSASSYDDTWSTSSYDDTWTNDTSSYDDTWTNDTSSYDDTWTNDTSSYSDAGESGGDNTW